MEEEGTDHQIPTGIRKVDHFNPVERQQAWIWAYVYPIAGVIDQW
jgi:hypothetical protein